MRLVTLTGPGGVGKTRLAIRVAEQAAADFPDGVWFVPLAPLRSPGLIAPTIAQVLGVCELGQRSVEDGLQTFLRSKSALLVLDNFEHLLDAAPLLTALLMNCPQLSCLVTSRETLRVSGEQGFPVSLLDLPDSADSTVAQIAESEAVRLFVARAQAVRPGFAITDANAVEVGAVCRVLDGLPLAIELAAARVRLLSPGAILARLVEPGGVSHLLTGGPRDAPERHRMLSETVAWSYDLLTPGEQVLFRRLAAFAGGCTLEAAEAVARGGVQPGMHEPSPPVVTSVFDGLASLVDMNLLQAETAAAGEPRFVMLETIRAFGQEQLVASGEARAVHERHANYFLGLAERAEPELLAEAQADWLARLAADQDNLRAALEWMIKRRDGGRGLRLGGALRHFWHRHGAWEEGRAWLSRLLALPDGRDGVSLASRAKALAAAGWLAHYQNDFPAAVALLEESLACHQRLGRTGGLADVLVCRGLVARFAGQYPRAIDHYQEALSLARDLGDRAAVAEALFHLAMAVREAGDFGRAAALCEEALALHRQSGHRRAEAVAQLGLGDVARDLGDSAEVRARCGASLAIFRDLGDPWGEGFSLHNLAVAAYQEGDHRRARRLGEESVRIFRRLGVDANVAEVQASMGPVLCAAGDLTAAADALAEAVWLAQRSGPRWIIAASLEGLAGIGVRAGQYRDATVLASSASALREKTGVPVRPNWRGDLERTMAAARSTLHEQALTGAWAAGQARPIEQVVTEAHAAAEEWAVAAAAAEEWAVAAAAHPQALSTASGPSEPRHGLSTRELEVLRLLVAGRRDREIAEALFISPRTASKHVGSILAKLEVASRAEAAVRAVHDRLL